MSSIPVDLAAFHAFGGEKKQETKKCALYN